MASLWQLPSCVVIAFVHSMAAADSPRLAVRPDTDILRLLCSTVDQKRIPRSSSVNEAIGRQRRRVVTS